MVIGIVVNVIDEEHPKVIEEKYAGDQTIKDRHNEIQELKKVIMELKKSWVNGQNKSGRYFN